MILKLWQFLRQVNAINAGLSVIWASAAYIAWGILKPNFKNEEWAQNGSNLFINLTINMYYIGNIFGLVLSSLFQKKLTKRKIYAVAAFLTIVVNGALFNFRAYGMVIMSARLFSGIITGYIWPTLLIHASEIVPNKWRGVLISYISWMINMVIAMMLMLYHNYKYHFVPEISIFVVIFGFTFGLSAITFGQLRFKDSPIYILQEQEDGEDSALDAMMFFRRVNRLTPDIQITYDDTKTMINEDKHLSSNILEDSNKRPLFLVGLTILLHVLSFNLPLNLIRFNSIVDESRRSKFTILQGTFCIRLVFGIIGCMVIDIIGRRKILLCSGSLAGLVLIIYAVLINTMNDLVPNTKIGFFLVYEGVLAIGINAIPYIYMAEVFSLAKKFNSIVAGIIFESALHIILIAIAGAMELTTTITSIFLFGSGGLIMVLTTYLYINLPETANLTLREARDVLRK